jgi:hypothetical protein
LFCSSRRLESAGFRFFFPLSCHFPVICLQTGWPFKRPVQKLSSFLLLLVNLLSLLGLSYLLDIFVTAYVLFRPLQDGIRVLPFRMKTWLRNRGLHWPCFCALISETSVSCQIVRTYSGQVMARCTDSSKCEFDELIPCCPFDVGLQASAYYW